MSPDPGQQHEVAALAAAEAVIEAQIALADLQRIRPLLRGEEGLARGLFRFHRESALAVAEGHVSATLTLTCQRCLGEMTLPVDTDSRLVFVADAVASADLAGSREPVIAVSGQVSLAMLIEEELLLALPLAPMHRDADDCHARPEEQADQPRHKPFAGLRDLMKD